MEDNLISSRIINSFLVPFNLVINVLYSFCLIFPSQTGQRKQPLTLLLGFIIHCIVIYCISLAVLLLLSLSHPRNLGTLLSIMGTDFAVDQSMASFVWLNFYYYIQIVPAPFALFHWAKRNIKCTIYALLCIDTLVIISSKLLLNAYTLDKVIRHGLVFNATVEKQHIFSFYMVMGHYFVMLSVTVMSSWCTVRYLYRHIQNMGKMQTPISAARLRGQMRITITGMCQGVLYLAYMCGSIFLLCTSWYFAIPINMNITYITTTLIISGTTVTLGIGQTVFRKKIFNMYESLKRHLSLFREHL